MRRFLRSRPSPGPGLGAGLAASIPIALGYLPIAFSFGIAAVQAGLRPVEAVALSLMVYAGASQFLALALLTSGAPILVAAGTLIAMNIRHVLYGPALLRAAGAAARTRTAWAWGAGLTDEVFAAALGRLARGEPFSEAAAGGLALGAYAAWVLGTALGAAAGGGALAALPLVEAGLSFMLPALFFALLLSILTREALPAIFVAAGAAIAGTLLWSGTAGILCGMILGALAGTVRR